MQKPRKKITILYTIQLKKQQQYFTQHIKQLRDLKFFNLELTYIGKVKNFPQNIHVLSCSANL